mgnify:FL=1|jgi:hypothetical protein
MKYLQKVYHWVDNRLREITTWSGIGVILISAGAFFNWPVLLVLGAISGVISIVYKED